MVYGKEKWESAILSFFFFAHRNFVLGGRSKTALVVQRKGKKRERCFPERRRKKMGNHDQEMLSFICRKKREGCVSRLLGLIRRLMDL